MELYIEVILAAVTIVILSLFFGFLPLFLARKYDFSSIETTDPEEQKRNKKQWKNMVLSFLLNLGAGVLLANCFCHWLPEVREGIEHHDIDSKLPLAEVIMCAGFFFICALEETLHHFLHPHQEQEHRDGLITPNNKIRPLHSTETEFSRYDSNSTNNDSGMNTNYDTDTSTRELTIGKPIVTPIESCTKEERSAAQVKSALRTFFVVFALSFHSTIEGLALILEEESAGVWLNCGATSLHKFVISFSVGVELVSTKVKLLQYIISIVVFSLAPALGAGIGVALTLTSDDHEINDLPLQILQGIATGTIVYVVFFEIFPKAKEVGGTGFQHVISMILGFAIFLPSLYFHGAHEGHGDDNCPNATLVYS